MQECQHSKGDSPRRAYLLSTSSSTRQTVIFLNFNASTKGKENGLGLPGKTIRDYKRQHGEKTIWPGWKEQINPEFTRKDGTIDEKELGEYTKPLKDNFRTGVNLGKP